ncbi:MAG: YeeE/YedE family protein [Verrucomicrobiales bacterium]|nr:YeeE/YedE family protein [Verrucomicrobiales bacterium]
MKETNRAAGSRAGAAAAAPHGRWNAYWVGAGIGVLSWVAFAVVNQPLGISTALSAASGVCALPVMGVEGVAQNAYWAKTPFKWDGGMLFLVGTFLGSFLSAWTSRTWRWEIVPSTWAGRFGSSGGKRLAAAFIGGAIIMYGARLAGGCTSGHGISGSLQLALSSWTFFLTMFGSGVVTAWLLFRRHSRSGRQ